MYCFLERNTFDHALIFAFGIQPPRKVKAINRIGVFPIGNCARDQLLALCRMGMDAKIERKKFMLCFGERVIFKRRGETPGLVPGGIA